ncbi:MAG: hypothetical protein NDJ72_13875 [Elusimicrobia bacterium]|nr:hypothetical protein [Elusimicrobiota bacterium]
MDFNRLKKPLTIAAVVCVLGGGAWWALTRGGSARKTGAGEAAAPPAPVDPAVALLAAHRAAGAAKDWPRQEALWAEIAALSADEPGRRRQIQDDRAGWLMRALRENDDASADRLAAAMAAATGNDEINPRHALKEWRARQLEKWRAARAAKDAAAEAKALAAMSSWEPLDSDLPRDLVAAASPSELLTLGQAALKDGAYAQAAVLLTALTMARGDQTRARILLDDAIMGLAAAPALAVPAPDGPPPSVDLYQRVAGPRRGEALSLAAALIEARADELLADKPGLSGPLYDDALRRLNEVASLERRPVAEPVAARLGLKAADARMSAVLKMLDTAPDLALAELRPLFRDGKDEGRRQRALESVVGAWRKARDAGAFDRLADLSAYLVAEAGAPDPEDPFRAEFKAGLAKLAEDSKKESLNKQVFALSLLADAFPADPEGLAARRDGAARGADLARAAAERGQPPQQIGNSGLTARSVALVENGAAHPVLMVFDGPETFFVRVNPYRRGSVVLKDGKYLVGVFTLKGEIAPYASETTLGSVLVRQKFTGPAPGPVGPGANQFGFTTYGHWSVLRAPAGETYAANPMNGTVRP